MPRAVKQVFWRILLFYVLSIVVIAAIIPYTDPLLLNKNQSVSQSPFTIVFDRIGIAFADQLLMLSFLHRYYLQRILECIQQVECFSL